MISSGGHLTPELWSRKYHTSCFLSLLCTCLYFFSSIYHTFFVYHCSITHCIFYHLYITHFMFCYKYITHKQNYIENIRTCNFVIQISFVFLSAPLVVFCSSGVLIKKMFHFKHTHTAKTNSVITQLSFSYCPVTPSNHIISAIPQQNHRPTTK